jgi:Uma2 family endonuclease
VTVILSTEEIWTLVRDLETLTATLERLTRTLGAAAHWRPAEPEVGTERVRASDELLVAQRLAVLAARAQLERLDRGLDPRRAEGHARALMVALRTSPAGFPMAPSAEEWAALSPAEREAVVAALPGEVTAAELSMSEGERHFRPKIRALEALRGYFTRQRRRVYLAAELPTYYPNEPRFAPDLFVVFDADDTVRDKWIVSAEGNKGLDWVLEVHVGGDRKKDAELNVARYARLGIPEYFLYDARSGCAACGPTGARAPAAR